MRNDLETREIADTELDAVAGGVATISGGLVGAVTSDVSNVLNSLETTGVVTTLVDQVAGQAAGITGVHVNTGAVTGLVGL
ncbi:hypothetical protein [Streptomyces litchfieldiae]|uniref:Type A2 lantipeptide n=1 Tax=Streptomyces litchfieldiae TaxID=3075543 RepID=A0ABU2MJ55_9ACTN|nr:hypothetical protein [Streptomyces sp. DSM 44938]MDT0341506.1 hypothetical protein [Streptomyces sp. DSM 44938]